ncbi:MAG: hypothetical protein ABSF52_08155 [Syntrophobacteraceae bacterium]|jgi:hypothetical protein
MVRFKFLQTARIIFQFCDISGQDDDMERAVLGSEASHNAYSADGCLSRTESKVSTDISCLSTVNFNNHRGGAKMRKLALLAAVVCLICCCGMNAEAQTWTTGAVSTYHYVGPSKGSTDGNAHGIVGMNALCQATYKATAHMCNTDEFFQTAAVPKGGQLNPATMWIQTAFHECIYDGYNVMCWMSGMGRIAESPWANSCTYTAEWTSNDPSLSGSILVGGSGYGAGMSNQPCNSSYPVACCAP